MPLMQTHGSPNSKATLPVTKPFHPRDAAQGRSCPRNRTRPGPQPIWNKQCHGQQSPSTSTSSSSSSSCCQAASRAGFLFFPSLSFYFLCHFFFDSGWIDYWRGCLGTQSLMQEKKKKLIWKRIDQSWWASSADWRGAQEHVLFLGAKVTHTQTHTKNNTLW